MALPEWPPQVRGKIPPELFNWWQAFKAWVGTWSNPDGSVAPVNSIYYSLTLNKLAFKDSAGSVHALY